MYNRWPATIGQAEVCLVQPPGRENRIREPHYGTYEELAKRFVDAVLPYLDRPFGFFGHCGGALPGFATALELTKRGLPQPRTIFISSQIPPHIGPSGRFLTMTNYELAGELAQFTRELGGRPQPDLISMSLRVLRADIDANKKYHLPSPILLNTAVRVIGWNDDIEVRPEQMIDWSSYCISSQYHETLLDGSHYSFLHAPPHLLHELEDGMSPSATISSRLAVANDGILSRNILKPNHRSDAPCTWHPPKR
jgi:surfactin synthase thioesterase subunit